MDRQGTGFPEPMSRNEAILQNILGANNVLGEPSSRIEVLLQAILYNDPSRVDFTPTSRAELLLYAILTSGTYDGETRSRNEAILKAILEDGCYMQQPRSRIEALLIQWLDSTPWIREVHGAVVSVADALAAPVAALTVGIEPVQAGSGDPSPENVRPITGWTGANIHVSPTTDPEDGTTYSIAFPSETGTVYGGILDVTNGVLTVDRAIFQKNTSTMNNHPDFPGWKNSGIRSIVGNGIDIEVQGCIGNIGNFINAKTLGNSDTAYFTVNRYGKTQDEWIALAKDIQFVIPLASPQTYQLTPTEIATLLGVNNVWADTGDVTMQYYARRICDG